MTEVRIRPKSRGHVYAELLAPCDAGDQLALAEIAVDAISALGAGLFEPLSVDGEFPCHETEFGLPLPPGMGQSAPYHQLRVASLPADVQIRGIWTDTVITRCERLDRATILSWIAGVLAGQRCSEPDTRPGWNELVIETVRARLPDATAAGVEGDELLVSHGAGVIAYPVERSADALWVAGPHIRNFDTVPFEVTISKDYGSLSLQFSTLWSLWIDGPGHPDIEAASRRLSALGWDVRPFVRGGM
ncbi:hypothetical protein KIPE111705_04665 [Kibdelosporangium persicum]|uniref:hypothetical protein n=1 Tax=Kibdelosporangium persicum TaxID=2698649 RepID=UPI0015675C0E|nr:hypothetical protein [Kibdelosporangium persicum]